MSARQKPGETPNQPGQYREVGPRGGEVSKPRTIHMPPGDKPLPPTQESGHRWQPTRTSGPKKGSK